MEDASMPDSGEMSPEEGNEVGKVYVPAASVAIGDTSPEVGDSVDLKGTVASVEGEIICVNVENAVEPPASGEEAMPGADELRANAENPEYQ